MKRAIAGTFVAAACAVSLAAQTPATPPQSQPMKESDTAKTVTVTGCLKAGSAPESFMLSNLKWKDDKAVGTSGAVTPAAPPVGAAELKLVGNPSTKLSDHIGHTIEVTGTIADKADKPTGSATDPAARPSPSASAQASLNVSNVRMIAATCQAQ